MIGDVMLDEFLWGRVSRISPEAPVPVVEVVRESFQLGGAANVAHNLHRLGAVPLLIGVLGEDEAARRLRDILSARGIAAEGLVDDGERPTTLKTRIIAHSQQVVRADRESQQDITKAVEALALERTTKAVARADALVLSDYSKGMLTPRLVEQSIALARNRQIPILVDPKLRRFAAYKHVSLVTPNVGEAEEASRVAIDGPTGLEGAANVILATLHCQAVLITRGEKGMALFEKQQSPVHIGAASREVFDVTGAGDTVIATAAFA
ncbi:MAG: bifunctional heptose 7-phosphate kinase/heptose 1-phosphate adenyltransferase, partial [Acidobacteriota bacterium]